MKLKRLILFAITTCTTIVIGTGIIRAVAIARVPYHIIPAVLTVAQGSSNEQNTPSEITAVNRAAIAYLRQGRENLPQTPSIRRTVVEDDYAIATWAWGEAGGQAVLSLADDEWKVLSSGGGAVDASTLEELDVPEAIAERLMESDRSAREQEVKP